MSNFFFLFGCFFGERERFLSGILPKLKSSSKSSLNFGLRIFLIFFFTFFVVFLTFFQYEVLLFDSSILIIYLMEVGDLQISPALPYFHVLKFFSSALIFPKIKN